MGAKPAGAALAPPTGGRNGNFRLGMRRQVLLVKRAPTMLNHSLVAQANKLEQRFGF